MDPFAVLGLDPTLDLDDTTVEATYLAQSRTCHPDHHGDASPDEQIAILSRAAALNDAYRVLRDPWRRAEALLEIRAPGVIDRNKKLDPSFLMSAMELSEEVAEADATGAEPLRQRIDDAIADHRARLREAAAREDWDAAATLLHESRYFRKARQDLEAPR